MELLVAGRSFRIAGEVSIGSDPTADIHLTGKGVHARHARVCRGGDGRVLVHPATDGATVMLNGSPIGPDPEPVAPGDMIRIAEHDLLVSEGDQARSGSGGQAVLTAMGESGGREFALGAVTSLGRDAQCDVVVQDQDASRRHADILGSAVGWALVDRSTNGTLVNGARVSGARRALVTGDVIRIGREEYRFTEAGVVPGRLEAPAPAQGAKERLSDTLMNVPGFSPSQPPALHNAPPDPNAGVLATLQVRSGSRKGERIQLRTPVVHVGRGAHNEVCLPEASVSQSHARLTKRDAMWRLEDLGSTNGTTVEGMPSTGETRVGPGSTIRFGDVTVVWEPPARGSGDTGRLPTPVPGQKPPGGTVRRLGPIIIAALAVLLLLLTFVVF